MYTIHGKHCLRTLLRNAASNMIARCLIGGKDLEEIELTHLDGHKGSKPVRIGNGAADHVQLVCFCVLSCFPA